MLNNLSNMLNNGLRSLKTGIVNRFKLFNPWDYVLLSTTTLLPFFVATPINPILITGITWFTIGTVILLPRGVSIPTKIPDSPYQDRVSRIVEDIFNEAVVNNKPIHLPDHVILNNSNSNNISAEALITDSRKKLLKINGNISQLSDEELEMLISHELAHFHFKDPVAQDYSTRIFWTSMLLGLFYVENYFLLTAAFCATQFLISQASNRYREYRADHYATINHENDTQGDPRKIKDLTDLVDFLHRENSIEPNHNGNFIDQVGHYCLHAYRHPETLKDKVANTCLHLLSSHPSPLYRTKR
ncbi:MAG: M48 family metalloprotease [Candidatus Berkiella sp.]